MTNNFDNSSTHAADDALGIAIKQLKTIDPGSVQITNGSSKFTTKHRNAIQSPDIYYPKSPQEDVLAYTLPSIHQSSKRYSFVFVTCVLSTVSLLAMPIAQLVMMMA